MKMSRLEKLATWQQGKLTTPWLLNIAATLGLFAEVGRIFFLPDRVGPVTYFASIALLASISLSGIWLIRVRERYKKRVVDDEADFKHIFGAMSMIHDVFAPGVYRIIQARVDTVLTRLAEEFDAACVRQQEFLASIPREKVNEEQTLKMLDQMRELTFQVDSSKAAFWNAHRLARNFDFNVGKSFKDYLISPQP